MLNVALLSFVNICMIFRFITSNILITSSPMCKHKQAFHTFNPPSPPGSFCQPTADTKCPFDCLEQHWSVEMSHSKNFATKSWSIDRWRINLSIPMQNNNNNDNNNNNSSNSVTTVAPKLIADFLCTIFN